MKRNHYGIMVDSDVPVVGVVVNHEPEWLCEDINMHGIDIDLEEYIASCESEEAREEAVENWCESGTMIIGFKEWDLEGYAESCKVTKQLPTFQDAARLAQELNPYTITVGQAKIYVPDQKFDYQAICGEVYTQILRSKWVQSCNLCSPCYPGQGDLDSPGDFLAYTLPADMWGDRMDWRKIVQADMAAFYADCKRNTGTPMPDFAFRILEDVEGREFRMWARQNYTPGSEISGLWHPTVKDECEKMNAEVAR